MIKKVTHYKARLKETSLKAILTDFLLQINSLPVEVSLTLNGQLIDHINVIDESFIHQKGGEAYFVDVELDVPTRHFVSIISKH